MNQDIRRTFLIRLIVLSVVAFTLRYTLVLPRVHHVQEMREQFEAQTREIEQGEQSISRYSGQIITAVEKMSQVRDDIAGRFAVQESTQIHKRLQHAAEHNMLTVSRIEPMRTSTSKAKSGTDAASIELETLEFKIECEGPYSGIVAFLDELGSGSNMAKVTMFRMVPTAKDSARLVMQVALHQLIKTPEAFSKKFDEQPTPSSEQQTDRNNDTGDADGQA